MGKTKCSYALEDEGSVLVVSLFGEIDHHSAVNVRGEIDNKIQQTVPVRTVLDLGEINFMDSSGLGLVMGRYALMQRLGGELVVRNPNERVVRIFEIAGLGRIVKIENKKERKKP